MKFNINSTDLTAALSLLSSCVMKKGDMPVLANVLMEVVGEKLILTTSNLECEMRINLPLNDMDASEGAITVDAKKFYEIVKSVNADITFMLKDDHALVQSGKSKFKFKTLPADQFPNIEHPDSDSCFDLSIDAKTLERELSRIQFAMGKNDVRSYLNGMAWTGSEKGIRMAATDGHRLAVTHIECKAPEFNIILPRKSVMDTIKLIGKLDENIDIKVSDSCIQFKSGDLNYTSKLIVGKYPDIERVIPKQNTRLVNLDKTLIKNILQQGMITANDNSQIRLTFNEGQLFVSSDNNTNDSATCSIETDDKRELLVIGFNGQYLIDALSNVTGNELVIAMKDSNTSSIIQSANDDHYQFIVMPMKL